MWEDCGFKSQADEIARTSKSTQRECRFVVANLIWVWGMVLNWCGVSFQGNENVLELDSGDVA